MRQGRGTLGKLVTDDTLYWQLNEFVESAEAVTRSMNSGRGTIGRLINNPAAARSLEASLAEPADGDRPPAQRRGKPRSVAEQ